MFKHICYVMFKHILYIYICFFFKTDSTSFTFLPIISQKIITSINQNR